MSEEPVSRVPADGVVPIGEDGTARGRRERAKESPLGRWRTLVSATLIVVAAVLVPVSAVAAWARLQLVDEDAFVATLAPLAEDADVQRLIVDVTMDAVAPPTGALHGAMESAVADLVRSDAFAGTWARSARAVHRALTVAATSDGGGVVVRTADGLAVDVGALVAQARQRLLDRGVGAARVIPVVERTVVIGSGECLAMLRAGHALATVTGWWLPWVTVALVSTGIVVSRRRDTAVIGSGVAIALGSAALVVALMVGRTVFVGSAGDLADSSAAMDAVYGQLTGAVQHAALALLVVGMVTAAGGGIARRAARTSRVLLAPPRPPTPADEPRAGTRAL